jgi:hypothetical protein
MRIGANTIIILVILVVLSLFIAFYDKISILFLSITKKSRIKRKLKKIAKNNDYLLLNNLVLYINDYNYIEIEHLLIANKYIYVLTSKSYYGDINGIASDNVWRLYKGSRLSHISNPLPNNLKRLRTVAHLTNLDEKNFISLVIINKPSFTNDIRSSRDNEFVVRENELTSFIKEQEGKKTVNEFTIAFQEKIANVINNYSEDCKIKLKRAQLNNIN